MSKMLRVALLGDQAEGEPTPDDSTIVMQGPLAEIYRRALDIAYANKDPITGAPALETQAQDAEYAAQVINLLLSDEESLHAPMTVWGVQKIGVRPDDVVELARCATNVKDPSRMVVVVDYTKTATKDGGCEVEVLTKAMEGMVVAMGGHVVHSLEGLQTLVDSGTFRR